MALLILAKRQESQIDAHGAEELDTFSTSDTDQTFLMFPLPKFLDRMSRIRKVDSSGSAFVNDFNKKAFSDTVDSGAGIQHDLLFRQADTKASVKLNTGPVMMFIDP